MNEFCGFGYRTSPARRSGLRIVYLFIDAGEFPGVEPDAATNGALIDLDAFEIRKPFAIEDPVRTTRTQPRLGELFGIDRGLPDGVKRCGRAGGDFFEFVSIKPDAAATAVAHVECHAARAFFQKRIFARGTFHKGGNVMHNGPPGYAEFHPVK
jgi:hypothetical protein